MTNTNETKVEILREKTVAFTGNRELKTPNGIYDANLENVIRTELAFCFEECYEEGKNCFISGMAVGWDMMCAEEVLKFKTKHPDVKLIVAIPFYGQEAKFSTKDQIRYQKILKSADHCELITNGGFDNDAYHKRNDWMIDHCSELLAYDSGSNKRSGTTSTIRKATAKGLPITNFFEEFSTYFQISHSAKQLLQKYPHVTSFKYGREGLILEGDNRPHFLSFDNIESIESDFLNLNIKHKNGVTYIASIFTDECVVETNKMPNLS